MRNREENGLDLLLIKLVTIVITIVAAGIRVIEFENYYDLSSGTLQDEYFLATIGLALIGVVIVLFAAICYKDKMLYGEFVFNPSVPAGIMDIFSAIVMTPGAIYLAKTWYDMKYGEAVAEGGDTTFILPLVILTVFMIAFMAACAVGRISGINYMYDHPAVSFITILWGLVFLLYNFVHNSLFIVRSENYYVIFTSVAILFACLAFVRNYDSFGNSSRVRLMFMAAPAAVMLSLSYSISELYLLYTGFERLKCVDFPVVLMFLASGLFFGVVLVYYRFDPLPEPVKRTNHQKGARHAAGKMDENGEE